MPEASMQLACTLSESFSMVTLGPPNVLRLKKTMARHGMQARVSSVHALTRQWNETELNAAFAEPEALIADFCEVARLSLAEGADLVIPAEGVLNEVLVQYRLHEIDGATVMDCVGAALLHAEMLVNARKKLGLGPGRRWARRPERDVLERLHTAQRANLDALTKG
jgi:Asp/Glu/hydantoin racemase